MLELNENSTSELHDVESTGHSYAVLEPSEQNSNHITSISDHTEQHVYEDVDKYLKSV